MIAISKNKYIDKLDAKVVKSSNAYHKTIKMKPNDVKASKYINFDVENNYKHPNPKVGDHVRISKYKNIFAQKYPSAWLDKDFAIKNVKKTVP